MDLPQFVYHQRDHSRYIPHLPSPSPLPLPPPPPPLFHEDPDFHHHHNLPEHALDFPLHPHPHASYRHLPMPQSPSLAYNPSQPHFTLPSTIHDDRHSIHDDHLRPIRDFSRFDGGFHRDLDLNSSYRGSRLDNSDPARVRPDNRSLLPHSPVDFDHGMYHREIDHRLILPYPPVDNFRYSSGNNSRLEVEYNDSFQTNPREEVLRGRGDGDYYHQGQFEMDPNSSFMESGATIAQSPLPRDKEFVPGSFDKHRHGSTHEKEFFRSRRGSAVSKNQRWVHSKQAFRNTHNETGSSDRGDDHCNDFRTISGKQGICGIGDRLSTPRKPIQKKSAFLRIQANPSHNNRESEQLHDSDYFDDKNNSSIRVRNQVRSLGHRMDEEKKREGSPMELDVSFKSNSLVAKAIVSSTQPGAVSDISSTPRNEKTTKVLVPDRKSPDSNLSVQSKDSVDTNGILRPATYAVGSKFEPKESEEKVTGLLVDNILNNSTDASSSVIVRRSQSMELDKEGNFLSCKASPLRAPKKKKIVRKVVKKVVSPQLCSQTKKCDDEPVDVDSLTNILPVVGGLDKGLEISRKKSTASRINPAPHFVLEAPQWESSESLENTKADQSLLHIALENCKDKSHTDKECMPQDTSEKNSSIFSLNSLLKDGGTGDHLVRSSSFIDIPPLLNSMEDPKLLNGPNEFDFRRVKPSKSVLAKIEDSLLENVTGRESGLLSFKDPSLQGDLVIGNHLPVNIDIPMEFGDGITQSRDNASLSETCFFDRTSKKLCAEEVTAPPEADTVGVSAAKVTTSSSLVSVSNSLEAVIQIDCANSECYSGDKQTIQDSDDCSKIRVNDIPFSSETIGNTRERASVDRTYVSPGTSSQEISPKAKVSVSGEKPMSVMIEIKNCLDFAYLTGITEETINFEDPCIGDISNKYCPFKPDAPGQGSVVLDVKSITTGDTVLHSYNVSSESSKNKLLVCTDVNSKQNVSSKNRRHCEKSPECRKKRKKCVASPVLPFPTFESNEGPAISFTSYLKDPLTCHGDLMEGEKLATSTVDALYTESSADCSKGFSMIVNDVLIKESSGKINIDNNSYGSGLKDEHSEKNSHSIQEELIVSELQSHYPSASGNEQKENGSTIMPTDLFDNMDIDIGKEKLGAHISEEQSMVCTETAQWSNSSEVSSQTCNGLYPMTEMAHDSLNHLQNHLAFPADGNKCSTANSHNEIMGGLFDAQMDMGSPEISNVPGILKSNVEASPSHTDSKMDSAEDKKAEDKSLVENKLRAMTDTSSPQSATINQKSGHANAGKNSTAGKVLPLALKESKSGVKAWSHSTDLCKKKQVGHYTSQKSFSTYIASKKLAPATRITKPRSWHRNVSSLTPVPGNKALSSSVPPLWQLHGRNGNLQSTSYIRKGNSLVRKPSQVATKVLSSNSSDQHGCKPSVKAYSEVNSTDPSFVPKSRGISTPVDKPDTPPLSVGSISPDHLMRDCALSSCHETESDRLKSKDIGDPVKISFAPESQTVSADKMENQIKAKDMTSASSIVKKIIYVKRKSNQLVAASNTRDLSTNNMGTVRSLSTDGYYKRNKNQLIRASSKCQMKQTSTDNISNSGAQSSSGDGDGKSLNKKPQCKVVAKTHRSSKSSLVWTLCSSVAPGNGDVNLQNQKTVPCLFPWKRSYWRTLKLNTSYRNNSSSVVRKLLLLRNRNTLYERSKHGFSLRKSKVVSVGRTSLKWSKSIENRSKKANEEATRAVADAERKKRERNCDASACSKAQGGNPFCYDKSSCSTTLKSEKSAKKFYIPGRLVIGNDEYVKIGNGNQLVRNPKRRARILANEKIRWSLHTARQRLAKKRKYCQFFTRFGKCDKDGGKCPYIHDTSKIAVCTKFLNGLCFNPNCKLTHKVIPERMPDCSYFLQGICSSKNCAYRHVNVNSKATTCEAFLRGYCALGNECRKKHSYVCPLFEATGSCPEGSKCKLHHPNKQTKGRKRKRSGGKNNGQGRYFGSKHIDVSGSGIVVTEKRSVKPADQFLEGDLADYISLDASDEEVAESNNSTSWRASFCEGSVSDSLSDDPDEQIKPVRIMNKNTTLSADLSMHLHSVQALPMCH